MNERPPPPFAQDTFPHVSDPRSSAQPEVALRGGRKARRVLTTTDGRRLLILRRRADGFEVRPLEGAFRSGERFEVEGTYRDGPAVCTFAVGRVTAKGFRARAIEIR